MIAASGSLALALILSPKAILYSVCLSYRAPVVELFYGLCCSATLHIQATVNVAIGQSRHAPVTDCCGIATVFVLNASS